MGKRSMKGGRKPTFHFNGSAIFRLKTCMRLPLSRLLSHLPTTNPFRLDRTLRVSGVKQAQFVSYLESSGYRSYQVDRYEQSMRRRRLAKAAFFWITAFVAAWIVIESAKALVIY